MSLQKNHIEILKAIGCGAAAVAAMPALLGAQGLNGRPDKPNFIYILADDLGYNEVGCYGQTKIKTPNLDRLAEEGMRFTQAYSGSAVCAPSRCTLLEGMHTGHAYIRNNKEIGTWESYQGQEPIPGSTFTIAEMLKQAGYATACTGKWGLGGPGPDINTCTGIPTKQGFDFYYGYLCQRLAHQYYPDYLWKNAAKDPLNNPYFYAHQTFPSGADKNNSANYAKYKGNELSGDHIVDEALNFIQNNTATPFFLYYATTVPHVALQCPDLDVVKYSFPNDTPYLGTNGYLPSQFPHATYAAMITRFDRHVGMIMNQLKTLGIDSNTIVIFTSDNGTTFNGGCDADFFESVKPLRALKGSLHEGGIRVPLIARWPGKIAPGTVSNHACALWDMLPTYAELAGIQVPAKTDGISIAPTLLGQGAQKKHEFLYWELDAQQCVLKGDWKAYRSACKDLPDKAIELYNLKDDISETKNVASANANLCKDMIHYMKYHRKESSIASFQLFPAYNFPECTLTHDVTIAFESIAANIGMRTLVQNYPNPFKVYTSIKYNLYNDAKISLVIYDSFGKEIRTLVNKMELKGRHASLWDGKDNSGRSVKPGAYFYCLTLPGNSKTGKMVLLK